LSKRIRLLVVDDHAIFRKGLAKVIQPSGLITVVGEAADGLEGLQKARELAPDLILMDIHMPRCDGLRATRLIAAEMPEIKIIMLTISEAEADLFEAIKSGAQGYLLKNIDPDELIEMLKGISRGEAPISRPIAGKILAEFASLAQRGARGPSERLTPRETEVLQLVGQGASNKQIACQLVISQNTVKNHLRNILAKLHLENRAQVVAYAHREGLIRTLPPSV